MNIQILGWLFLLYLLVFEPFVERKETLQFAKNWKTNKNARLVMYKKGILRNWILGVVVLLLAWVCNIPLSKLGLRPIEIHYFSTFSMFTQILVILFVVWYFLYFYFYATIGVRIASKFSDRCRQYAIRKIKNVEFVTPRTGWEYWWWVVNAFTSAVEELAYRGFVFYFLPFIFPGVSIWFIVLVSISLEAIRYFPRWSAMKYVATSGLTFALCFVVFHSIFAAMLLHVIYDLRTLAVPFHWARREVSA